MEKKAQSASLTLRGIGWTKRCAANARYQRAMHIKLSEPVREGLGEPDGVVHLEEDVRDPAQPPVEGH